MLRRKGIRRILQSQFLSNFPRRFSKRRSGLEAHFFADGEIFPGGGFADDEDGALGGGVPALEGLAVEFGQFFAQAQEFCAYGIVAAEEALADTESAFG